jgi:hypothetical protein
VDLADVWLPDEALVNEAEGLTGEPSAAKMREWTRQACEVDTQWCNGDIDDNGVEGYHLLQADGEPYGDADDDDGEARLVNDSCWGFCGVDRVNQDLEDAPVHARQTVVPPSVFVDPAMASLGKGWDGAYGGKGGGA